ncbi:hypothetical protein MFERI14815_00787 [Mycoplasma feriruminatoris]|uniref:PDxFFG protein n=1 Tax=Mycoplasma feriruminatoris TaxID=1179777 RepID=UPI00241E9728|nr:PDxFFG protein [Mycoplasma feriruminatoris]WFQ92170.1 hypothetical protein MFERI14815_00787 [Mycoplasma feriruminatoris]
MAKINFKKYVWHKYAISAGLIIAATATILGSAYKYSTTSVEKLGRKNFSDKESFKNAFIDPNTLPVTQFSEIHNNKFKVDYDPVKNVVKLNGKEMSVEKYLDEYYKKYHALPYLNIRYGSFNFYNQYIEAVSPQEFYKFTQWFMKNVSWGPEIITLKSFSIVKGVEMNGNSITLGAHSNKNKEDTTIKFYPDAFFGTLPIYSNLSGRGNAHESLTYKLNQQVLTQKDLESFLTNISNYNSLANLSQQTIDKSYFRGITNVSFLKGQKVFAYKQAGWYDKFSKTYSQLEKNRLDHKSDYLFVVPANSLEEARKKLESKFAEYKKNDPKDLLKNIDPKNVVLEEKTIESAEVKRDKHDKAIDKLLSIKFTDNTNYYIHNAFDNVLTEQTNAEKKTIFVELKNYIQFSKAVEEFKNKLKNIQSQINELIKSKTDKSPDLSEINKQIKSVIDESKKLDEKTSEKNSSELAKTLKELSKRLFEQEQQLTQALGQQVKNKQFKEQFYYDSDIAYSSAELISIETLVEQRNKVKLNWRDFYNIDEFVSDRENINKGGATEFFAYSKYVSNSTNGGEKAKYDQLLTEDDLIVAKTKIELVDILVKKKILKPNSNKDEIDKVISKVDLTSIKKENKNLLVTLKEVVKEKSNNKQREFGSKQINISINSDAKNDVIRAANDLFSVLGYKKMVSPSVLKEESDLRNPVTNEIEKTFNVYADAYENLIEELLEKVPHAAQWLEGPHIKKTIDENGVMQYKLENGKYLGFTKDDRIGLWAILKMSDKNFKGISTDFLKFVGAHEYGHHITLNGAHDLGNKGSDPIFISALTPGATPNINNYYSRDAVDLFLKARTHIELETKRLLDQFGVIKDYGEYAVFNFAKKTKDGKITFSTKKDDNALEKDSDIWGVDIENPSIRDAFSNKKRRFLQDFSGFLEAVKERQKETGLTSDDDKKWLSPFDLWVANAIDYYSGTLNPTVNSSKQENQVVKYMYKDEKTGKLKFQPASLKMLKGIIKDGLGKPIDFTESGDPKIVEGEKDKEGKYTKITKVLIHNKDGSPIVNVPLNEELNKDDTDPARTIDFVNESIKVVEKTIKSLVVDKYTINGWDKSDTRLSLDAKIDINYPTLKEIFGSRLPGQVNEMFKKIYGNYVSNRDVEKGSYKSNGTDSAKVKYYNLDGSESTVNEKYKNQQSSLIYANPKNSNTDSNNGQVSFDSLLKTLFTAGTTANNPTNAGSGQVLWMGKDKMYMPNVKLQDSYTDLYFLSKLPKEYEKIFNAKKVLKWMSAYTPTFISNKLNQNPIWNMMDKSGKIMSFDNATQNLSGISKLELNYSNGLKTLDYNILNGLFGSLLNLKGNKLEFNDAEKWLEFVNVDLTKAKYSDSDNAVNWDKKYVETKVDINEFKKNYKTHVLDKLDKTPGMNSNQKEAFKKFYEKANNDKTDQLWANEIMRRFSSSYFAMFNSALSIEQIEKNEELGWIFDSVHGYGEFKKSEFKQKGADENKWEIGVKDLLKAYEKLAEDLKVDFKQFNLVDSLVFDGKIQLYTDQTNNHIANQKFDLLSIFSSLATAQFHTSPSQDVLEYFYKKTERKFNELFSDYTYSFAEVINRDNLQITYSPSNHDFGNMPSFLSNISEATTGLEYVVDGTTTAKWKKKAIKINDRDGRNGIVNAILDYEKLVDNEAKNKAEALNTRYKKSKLASQSNLSDDSNYNNSYFGEFQSINNGWFKDRWYRDFLDFKLYDDDGKPIEDKTIRIKDLENKDVTSRVNAYWQFYIQSQGVGKRNISGIWRDATKDAVAMFGYLSSDVANKANYLAFKNQDTGEIKTVKINKQFSSNMFYYKTQNIQNEAKYEAAKTDEQRNAIRHTLAQEKYNYKDTNGQHSGTGFVSWVSDYAIMSKYQNALLTPGQKYSVYFSSDEKGTKDIIKTDLGNFESIAENGKTFSQAPIRMQRSKDPVKVDADGFKHYENTLYVYDQFNGVK